MFSPDQEQTSYCHCLEKLFQQTFPEPLSPTQLLFIMSQTNPDTAEYLQERINRNDLKGREQEIIRTLETHVVLEWANSGLGTFDAIAHPTPDIHTPTERLRLRRMRAAQARQTAHSPPKP